MKLYEVDYWNGTVLNVAQGMFAICKEFTQALFLCPLREEPKTHHFVAAAMTVNGGVARASHRLQQSFCGQRVFHDLQQANCIPK
jgi:hypothetical protein